MEEAIKQEEVQEEAVVDEGEVIELDRGNFRAKVKGLNIIKKHVKTTKENKGGIFDKENFIHLSNLKIIDDNKQKKK